MKKPKRVTKKPKATESAPEPKLGPQEGFRPFPDGPNEKLLEQHVCMKTFGGTKAGVTQVDFLVEMKIAIPNPRFAEKEGQTEELVRMTVTCAPPTLKDAMGRVFVVNVPERLWLAQLALQRVFESRSTFFKIAGGIVQAIGAREVGQ